MADGSRDVTIKIRLQAEGQADIRKGIEEAVSKPAKVAQGEMGKVRSSTVEAARGIAEIGKASDAVYQKMATAETRMAAMRRDERIKELKAKKRDAQEEMQLMQLTAEKAAQAEEQATRFRKIKSAERLAVYKREKAEEVRLTEEAESKKRASEAATAKFRKIAVSERLAAFKREKAEEARVNAEADAKSKAMEAAATKFKAIRLSERLAAYKRAKAEEVRLEKEAEAQKRAAAGQGGGFFSEQKGRFARGVAGAMAAPAAIGLGAQFANSIGDTLKTIAAIVRGDEEGAKRSPLYMAGVNFWEGVKEFSESTGLFRDILPKILPDFLQDEKKRRAETLKEDEAKALTLQAQLNDIILKRTQAERDLLAAEKQRIEAARQEFGLMTQPEQQAIANIAKKIGAGGIQALTGPELEQARGFQGFAGLISEQAKQAAGAGGFDAILAATGAAKRAADLEAKIKAEVKNTFNLDLDPADLANQLEEKIKPALAKVEAEMIKTLQSELKATETRIRQAQAIPLQ
jgi:hypothetical protein